MQAFFNRLEYDSLVTRFPKWMESNWPKLKREWTLKGVFVTGDSDIIEQADDLVFQDMPQNRVFQGFRGEWNSQYINPDCGESYCTYGIHDTKTEAIIAICRLVDGK